MNISDLTESNKAIKLRYFNKETNSKILMDVKWHLLGSNKYPYLSVNVRQVKKDDVVLQNYGEEVKQAIKELNNDFYDLLNYHLSNLDGSGNNCSIMSYHFNLAKDQFGKDIYTQEKHDKQLACLWDKIQNHSILDTVNKDLGTGTTKYLKEYIDKTSERYLYLVADRAFKHWNPQIKQKYNTGLYDFWSKPTNKNTKSNEDKLKDFFTKIVEYRKLTDKYKYKTLTSISDLWTPERLSEQYDLSVETVFRLMINPNTKDLLKPYIDKAQEKAREKLEELTNKYKIPLVITK